jgi:dihydrofolate reductase
MHIEAIAVTSNDGKIANKEGDAYSWVSPEDQKLFSDIKSEFSLIVMGRKTYESIKDKLKLSPSILRVVLTHTPQVYEAAKVENELEFISASPTTLTQDLVQRGYTSMLLVGGSQVYTEFIEQRLVNKFHVTVEPIVLGEGLSLTDHINIEDITTLVEETQLNNRGTIHKVYEFNA